jgi:uncharacterized protein (DUF58 family)
MLLGVVLAAINTGNNLLYLVLAALCSLLALSSALAEWNLRGVRVQRRLPAEAYAGEAALGVFVLENRRRLGPAWGVRLAERVTGVDAPVAERRVGRIGPLETIEVPARWTFPERGKVALSSLRVESRFPFGLVQRWREIPVSGSLVVWPRPASGPHGFRAQGSGLGRPNSLLRGREGDFRGVRPYVPGDSLRDLHWPTAARTGVPMVVVRDGSQAEEVVVQVQDLHGEHWEQELSRATGQIRRHSSAGHAVGLSVGGTTHPPREGAPWRRRLLDVLALLPPRSGFSA